MFIFEEDLTVAEITTAARRITRYLNNETICGFQYFFDIDGQYVEGFPQNLMPIDADTWADTYPDAHYRFVTSIWCPVWTCKHVQAIMNAKDRPGSF